VFCVFLCATLCYSYYTELHKVFNTKASQSGIATQKKNGLPIENQIKTTTFATFLP